MNRFFADNLDQPQVILQAGEAHHATHVLRLRAGAEVELFDGRGRTAVGRLTEAKRGNAVVSVERLGQPAARPQPAVHLAFAVPKGKRLDWLLEKATELGAAALRPVRFERSVAGGEMTEAKRRRWLAHCIAAAKQCGLNFLPEIRDPVSLDEFLNELGTGSQEPGTGQKEPARPEPRRAGVEGEPGRGNRETGTRNTEPAAGAGRLVRLLGDNSPAASSVAEALAASRDASQLEIENRQSAILVLVGPESGLTDAERQACVEAGFRPVRLGRTTLRTETAAISLLAAVTAILG